VKKSALAKYNNMEEKATADVDSYQATENQALLEVELPAKCRHSIKRVKKDTVLDIPHVPQIGTLICVPYLTRQVSKS
jgi:hypothetical protein